jgi:hypothetical protein
VSFGPCYLFPDIRRCVVNVALIGITVRDSSYAHLRGWNCKSGVSYVTDIRARREQFQMPAYQA